MSRRKRTPRSLPDHYSRRARAENYPARSVYKLEEIQKRHRVIKPGDAVLDLGCYPGSWLLFVSGLVGRRGKVVGIDKKPVTKPMPPNVTALEGDVNTADRDFLLEILGRADVVISDMAPDTTGNKFTDAARSFHLAVAAFNLAVAVLKPGGNFVCKLFSGEDFKNFTDMVKKNFSRCKVFKPESCRSESRETYVIGFSKKENTNVGSQ